MKNWALMASQAAYILSTLEGTRQKGAKATHHQGLPGKVRANVASWCYVHACVLFGGQEGA